MNHGLDRVVPKPEGEAPSSGQDGIWRPDGVDRAMSILRALTATSAGTMNDGGNGFASSVGFAREAYRVLIDAGCDPLDAVLGAWDWNNEVNANRHGSVHSFITIACIVEEAMKTIGYSSDSDDSGDDAARRAKLSELVYGLAKAGLPFDRVANAMQIYDSSEGLGQDMPMILAGAKMVHVDRPDEFFEKFHGCGGYRPTLWLETTREKVAVALDGIAEHLGHVLADGPNLYLLESSGVAGEDRSGGAIDINRGWTHPMITIHGKIDLAPLRDLSVRHLAVRRHSGLVIDGAKCQTMALDGVSIGAAIRLGNPGAMILLDRCTNVSFAPGTCINKLMVSDSDFSLSGLEAARITVIKPSAMTFGPDLTVTGELEFKFKRSHDRAMWLEAQPNPFSGITAIPERWTIGGGLDLSHFIGLESVADDLRTTVLRINSDSPYAKSGKWRHLAGVMEVELC